MKKTLFLTSLLIIGLSTNACVKNDVNTPTLPEMLPEIVYEQPVILPSSPQATISPTSGQTHQLKTVQGPMILVEEKSNGFVFPQYGDNIILLQIFGKECEYCFEEMPFIQRMRTKYAQKLDIVALQAQKKMTPVVAQNIIQEFNIDHPIIDRDEASNLLLFINKTYGWNGVLPYTLLIKNGVTEYSFSGEVNQQEFEEAIRSLY
ncbi:MAG: Unknown protein [uncultured Sulfurovum sp.]|uniref:Thioredoxin domain-containing protein n=1 Tax=uncultured Sulfurovum sp. TaxID=269237 RepID=A0A6S6TYM0_9BACT|nr:MAG: Unknown protein [uncultured Sulfurovum sp.]